VLQKVGNLSGGNQQKVVLSKWLFATPKVLILDEPTRGIDVERQVSRSTPSSTQLAAEGKGIVFISSEMPELLGMCDRIYVMSEVPDRRRTAGGRGKPGKDHADDRQERRVTPCKIPPRQA
jgi:ABC-type sugar transport system ATPase subunit